jgi:hypothetical protein
MPVLSFVVLCLGQTGSAIPAGLGGIEGKVVDDQSGLPLAGARIMAEPDAAADGGKPFQTATDETGSFLLKELPPGPYVVAASKEQDYYPNTDAAAFAADLTALPRVLVRGGAVVHGVGIRLQKGGRLLGTILDYTTGEPVIASRILLSRADNPKLWISTGPDTHGNFAFVIPCQDFLMAVSAPGYSTWNLNRNQPTGPSVLRLKPESTEKLIIRLERE